MPDQEPESEDRFVFRPPARASVPVAGSSHHFPVRRIYCVGRNYAAHIREMGGDERAPPFFFAKPADAIVHNGETIAYPQATQDLQHEVELVVAIGKQGRNVVAASAAEHVFGVAVGIDLTRRDLQLKARDAGRPWEAGKSFDCSAPISAIRPSKGGALPTRGKIALSVNGALRQSGDLSEMIWDCGEILSHLSGLFDLHPGDLIYTGTPSGVGSVVPGDVLDGIIDGVGSISITIGSRDLISCNK